MNPKYLTCSDLFDHIMTSETDADGLGFELPESVKVDDESARMLVRLSRAFRDYSQAKRETPYMSSSELLRAVELSDTTSVNYRMDTHLIPGNLVSENDTDGEENSPREYMATRYGIEWADENPSPLPLDQQINQLRRDLDDEVERVEEQVEGVVESLDQLNQQVESLSGRLGGVKSRGGERAERLDQIVSRIVGRSRNRSSRSSSRSAS
jgi:hypothetical protein